MNLNFKEWFLVEEMAYTPKTAQEMIQKHTIDKVQDPRYKALLAFVAKRGNVAQFERELSSVLDNLNIWTVFSPCMKKDNKTVATMLQSSGHYKGNEETEITGADSINQHGRSHLVFGDHSIPTADLPKYAAIYPGREKPPIQGGGYDYGNCGIKWNGKFLKDRITVASSDTLEDKSKNIISNFDNIIVPILNVGLYWMEYVEPVLKKMGIQLDQEYQQIRRMAGGAASPYLEVHIWGKLPINNQTVLEVLVAEENRGVFEDCDEELQQFVDWLQSLQIPVKFNDPAGGASSKISDRRQATKMANQEKRRVEGEKRKIGLELMKDKIGQEFVVGREKGVILGISKEGDKIEYHNNMGSNYYFDPAGFSSREGQIYYKDYTEPVVFKAPSTQIDYKVGGLVRSKWDKKLVGIVTEIKDNFATVLEASSQYSRRKEGWIFDLRKDTIKYYANYLENCTREKTPKTGDIVAVVYPDYKVREEMIVAMERFGEFRHIAEDLSRTKKEYADEIIKKLESGHTYSDPFTHKHDRRNEDLFYDEKYGFVGFSEGRSYD